MNTKAEYPTVITGPDAIDFAERVYIGSGDGIVVGNIAVLGAISTQGSTDKDISVIINNAFN